MQVKAWMLDQPSDDLGVLVGRIVVYDQIAWFETNSGLKKLPIPFLSAGYVDFLPYVYTNKNLSNRSISHRVSDHYPLWAELSIT